MKKHLKKLISVFVSPEQYHYSSSTAEIEPPEYKTTTLTSTTRLTPGCPYIRWEGPNFESLYNVTLVKDTTEIKGDEVLFAKLVDYIYTVRLTINGNVVNEPTLYRIDVDKQLAFQVFDINGDLATFSKECNERDIYGMSFPIILWSPDELDIKMEIISSIHLKPEEDPWYIGNHCLKTKCKSTFVYENVYDPSTSALTRVVSEDLKVFNMGLRYNYFNNYKKGCINTNSLSLATSYPPVVIGYNYPSTFLDYFSRFDRTPENQLCSSCYWWIGLRLNYDDSMPISVTNQAGTNVSNLASYIYFYVDGYVKVDFNLTFYLNYLNQCSSKALAALVNYYTKNPVQTYVKNAEGNYIVDGSFVVIEKESYIGDYVHFFDKSCIISVNKGDYLWIEVANLIIDHNGAGGEYVLGDITFTYLT